MPLVHVTAKADRLINKCMLREAGEKLNRTMTSVGERREEKRREEKRERRKSESERERKKTWEAGAS